jgi:hypothetical protein
MWKIWKKVEYQSWLFDIGTKEEDVLVGNGKNEIQKPKLAISKLLKVTLIIITRTRIVIC